MKQFASSPFAEMEHLKKCFYLFDRPYFVLSRPSLFGLALPLVRSGSLTVSWVDFFKSLAYKNVKQECFDRFVFYVAAENVLMPFFDAKKLSSLFLRVADWLPLYLSILKQFSPHLVTSFAEMISLIESKDEKQLEKYCARRLKASHIVEL